MVYAIYIKDENGRGWLGGLGGENWAFDRLQFVNHGSIRAGAGSYYIFHWLFEYRGF